MTPTIINFVMAGSIGGLVAGVLTTRTRIGSLVCGASGAVAGLLLSLGFAGAVVMGWLR